MDRTVSRSTVNVRFYLGLGTRRLVIYQAGPETSRDFGQTVSGRLETVIISRLLPLPDNVSRYNKGNVCQELISQSLETISRLLILGLETSRLVPRPSFTTSNIHVCVHSRKKLQYLSPDDPTSCTPVFLFEAPTSLIRCIYSLGLRIRY